jgi:hypothetical protein
MLALEKRLQQAIEAAVRHHASLNRAFVRSDARWQPLPGVLHESFSESESMLVGILIELWRRLYGIQDGEVDLRPLPEDQEVGAFFWSGAPSVASLLERLDAGQLRVLLPLWSPGEV